MKNLNKILIAIIVLSQLISCDSIKEEFNPINPQENTVDRVNGDVQLNPEYLFLEFSNKAIYRDAYQRFLERQLDYSFYDNHLPNFTSQRKAFDQIDSEKEYKLIAENMNDHPYTSFLTIEMDRDSREMEAVRVVKSPILAAMVNKDGMLKVGNTVQKFLPTKSLSVMNPTKDQIQQMIEWNGVENLGFGTIFNHVPTTSPNSASRSLEAQCTDTYKKGGRTFRVKGEQNQITIPWNGEVDREWITSVKHQIKSFGVWWGDKADEIGVSISGSYRIGQNGPSIPVNQPYIGGTDERSYELVVATCDSDDAGCDAFGIQWNPGAQAEHSAYQGNDGEYCHTSGF